MGIKQKSKGRPKISNEAAYQSMLLHLYKNYRNRAIQKKWKFEITFIDFCSIIFNKCYYCGRPPQNRQKTSRGDIIEYNGIDRIENEIGYIETNILPCCKICNQMKNDMGLSEFCSYISALVKHTKNWIK